MIDLEETLCESLTENNSLSDNEKEIEVYNQIDNFDFSIRPKRRKRIYWCVETKL